MRVFLFIGAILAFLIACLHLVVAKSAIHEIAAYVLFLMSAVLMGSAGIIEAVQQLRRDVLSQKPPA